MNKCTAYNLEWLLIHKLVKGAATEASIQEKVDESKKAGT
jgi:hypothetical protein